MEFAEVLAKRRMVRNYTGESVDPETLRRVASSALRAPSAGNSQGFAVVVVTEPERRAHIAKLANEDAYLAMGLDPWISRAPAHIVVAVSEKVYRDRYAEPDKLGPDGEQIDWPIPFWWVDAGAAMMAVLLAAVDEGLAAGFLGVHSIPDLSSFLGLPADMAPIGVITVGYPAPDHKSPSLKRRKKTANELVRFESWD